MLSESIRWTSLTLAALGALTSLAPNTASACGGFFCDSSQPVNQQAERIIFSRNAEGNVTAVIQIQYQGPSEQFAWMLPVAGSPEISVSSDAAFSRLQQASNPSYILNTTVEGNCRDDGSRFGPSSFGGADAGAAPSSDAGIAPPVDVVARGLVGPYDYVIIDVDPTAEDQAAVAITWLNDNGFDVPEMGSDVLRPYLEGGMNLLAFRLTKGTDTGSIRPVRLSFGPGLPSIPLRPTAIASDPDMGILVWVLGESRAVPANYRSLELNEALINWLNPGSTYDRVVTQAANEAMGQGFVTEMAGPATPFADVIWRDDEEAEWNRIAVGSWSNREGALLSALGAFSQLDGFVDAISPHVPRPDDVTEEDFAACPSCYFDRTATDIDGLEPALLLADFAEQVVEPMRETRALFAAAAYSTRLYTTMSAHEMTVDPIFDFNDTLLQVSNQHSADRIIECSPSISRGEAPWRVVLDDGNTVRGTGNIWPFRIGSEMPATARIVRVGTTGEGEVTTDNTAAISEALVTHNATISGPPPGGTGPGRGDGCSVSASREGAPLGLGMALAVVLGLVIRQKRR